MRPRMQRMVRRSSPKMPHSSKGRRRRQRSPALLASQDNLDGNEKIAASMSCMQS